MLSTPQSREAFRKAVEMGVLSDDIASAHYIGNYCFVGSGDNGNRLTFRNIIIPSYIHLTDLKAA